MVNYDTCKIYKIINKEMPNKVYFGSTTRDLKTRLKEHKCHAKTMDKKEKSKELFNFGCPEIILIEEIKCENKKELHERERFYIENNECLNKVVPNRTLAEHYIDNRSHRLQNAKKWRAKNKEKYAKYMKERYWDNRVKFLEMNKRKYTCECGSTLTIKHKKRHERSKKHQEILSNKIST